MPASQRNEFNCSEIRESPVGNRRLASLNRVLTAFQEFHTGRGAIPLARNAKGRNWRLDVVHEAEKYSYSLFRSKVGRIKSEIFGEKEGRAVRIGEEEETGRQTRVVLCNLTSGGGALFVSGHKAATSIPWNARLCMRRLLPRMRRYGTGNVCSRLIEFPAPAKVCRSRCDTEYASSRRSILRKYPFDSIKFLNHESLEN